MLSDHIHNNIITRIKLLGNILCKLGEIINVSRQIELLESIKIDYILNTVVVLSKYHLCKSTINAKLYKRIIISNNYIVRINIVVLLIKSAIQAYCREHPNKQELSYDVIECVNKSIEKLTGEPITIHSNRILYDNCDCGEYMIISSKLSQLQCKSCGNIRKLHGVTFKDDQVISQIYSRNKTNGHTTSRHYKFWIERLQALEPKTFDKKTLDNISYVISRDKYTKSEITCDVMRKILKDSRVNSTSLNDHVPLLVKLFGGKPPPRLTIQENKIASIKFNKIMALHDLIDNKEGNKPYYPYFIYQILLHMFINDSEKLRILDYIHLQSRETVVKNDKLFKSICNISKIEDGLIYSPVDPAFRL